MKSFFSVQFFTSHSNCSLEGSKRKEFGPVAHWIFILVLGSQVLVAVASNCHTLAQDRTLPVKQMKTTPRFALQRNKEPCSVLKKKFEQRIYTLQYKGSFLLGPIDFLNGAIFLSSVFSKKEHG